MDYTLTFCTFYSLLFFIKKGSYKSQYFNLLFKKISTHSIKYNYSFISLIIVANVINNKIKK